MDLSISPLLSNLIGSSAPTTPVRAADNVSSGSAAAGTAGTFAQALQSVDTGPAGIRTPSSAEDMTALLSMVEMKLDGTNSTTRDNSLASTVEGQRAGIKALVQANAAAVAAAEASFGADAQAASTAQANQSGDAAGLAKAQAALTGDTSTLAGSLQGSVAAGTPAETAAAGGVSADLAALGTAQDPKALAGAQANLVQDASTLASALAADAGGAGGGVAVKTPLDAVTKDLSDIRNAQDPKALASAQASLVQDATALTGAMAASTALAAVDADLKVIQSSDDVETIATAQTSLTQDASALASALDDGDAASGSAVQNSLKDVKQDVSAIASAQSKVTADATDIAKFAGDLTTIHTAQTLTNLALTAEAKTLQTGGGQHRRDAVTSQNLDLGFDALNQATAEMHGKAADRAVRANASLDAVVDDRQKNRDVGEVAASVAAGLVQIQAVLAALKAQQAAPAAPSSDGRVRLSL